jgi:hypothetical protein
MTKAQKDVESGPAASPSPIELLRSIKAEDVNEAIEIAKEKSDAAKRQLSALYLIRKTLDWRDGRRRTPTRKPAKTDGQAPAEQAKDERLAGGDADPRDKDADPDVLEKKIVACLRKHQALTSKAISAFLGIPHDVVREMLADNPRFENTQGLWRLMTE